jgi:hypothetical protein
MPVKVSKTLLFIDVECQFKNAGHERFTQASPKGKAINDVTAANRSPTRRPRYA